MNDNQYGLSSGVYTKDLGRGLRVSNAIRAGITFVNTYRLISPSAPFGGMKDSGYGKEAGIESIKDYTRIKTTWFNTSDKPMDDPFTMGWKVKISVILVKKKINYLLKNNSNKI